MAVLLKSLFDVIKHFRLFLLKKSPRISYCGTRVKAGDSCQIFLYIVRFAHVSKLAGASGWSFIAGYSRGT